jgi:hypothetical protein
MAERVVLTDEKYQELKAQFPEPQYELVKIEGLPAGDMVLRNPTEAEHQAFIGEAWSKEGSQGFPAAYRNALVFQCVFPEKTVLTAWLKRWPGLSTNRKITQAISYLSGQQESLAGKA